MSASPSTSTGWLDRLLGPQPDLPGPRGLDADRRAAVVLWSAAVILVLLIFRAGFEQPGELYGGWASIRLSELGGRIYWVAWGVVLYLVLPVLVIVTVLRESPARYGLRIYLTTRTALLYLLMLVAMTPLLFWASTQRSFLATYPMVSNLGDDWGRIGLWMFLRALRFVCLEFFFRGFLLFGLEEKLGRNAIAASALPYAIMHFAKPFPEALGAIAAGGVLGLLALRTRSIFGGALIHAVIAISMDLLALWKKGVLFQGGAPF